MTAPHEPSSAPPDASSAPPDASSAPPDASSASSRSLPRVPSRHVWRIAMLLLPIGVLANIAWTLLATDRAVLASLATLPRGYLLVALALTLTPWFTGTARLLVWTRFLGYAIPLRELFRLRLAVDIGNAVSPTAIGGETFKWVMLMGHGVRPGPAGVLAVLPKLEDAIFFMVALPVAVIWTDAWRLPVVAASVRLLSDNVLIVIGMAALLGVVAWLMGHGVLMGGLGARGRRRGIRFAGRSRRRLRRTRREAASVLGMIGRRGWPWLAVTLSLAAIQWIARYSVVSALALFLGVPFDPVLFWLLQWVVFTAMSFVPTPGAAGGAEIAFAAVYATLLPAGTIGVATAAWRVFTFYVPVGLAAATFPLTGTRFRLWPDQ